MAGGAVLDAGPGAWLQWKLASVISLDSQKAHARTAGAVVLGSCNKIMAVPDLDQREASGTGRVIISSFVGPVYMPYLSGGSPLGLHLSACKGSRMLEAGSMADPR